jgi:SH3-like domain-containing protein
MRKLVALPLIMVSLMFAAPAHSEDCSSKDVFEYQTSADLPETAYLRFDAINLRHGPGTRHCVKHVAEDQRGAEVKILGENEGQWIYLEYQADRYWVHRGLLSTTR